MHLAQRHGLHVTFMPKPIKGIAGSGMHVHQSLYRLEDGSNAFADDADAYGLSDIARHFIAGQLAHARGMSAMRAPIINSYQRLVSGIERSLSLGPRRDNLYHFTPDDLRHRHVETLPAKLGEAISEMLRDDVVCDALGEHVVEAQQEDWDACRWHVGGWARERYLAL